MFIKELSLNDYNTFVENNIIGNFYQSINYAMLKAEDGYDYEFIGLFENNKILAAALILFKKIGNHYYGYSPRGFLIDYSNVYLLESFTQLIKDYYKKKNFAFIKINPEIAISKLNKKTLNFEYNENYNIINNLTRCGYKKLKNNMNFESLLPRINAIVDLENLTIEKLGKNTRNKVKKGIRKGLTLEKVGASKINIIYNFLNNIKSFNKNKFYFDNFYNVFNKSNNIDYFVVKVDYKKYLINSQKYYNYELQINNYLNRKIINNSTSNIINSKMQSDKALLAYKNDIAEASKYINTNEETYVAAAMVIKYENRIAIKISGYDNYLKRYPSNYFLYFSILNYYKNDYKYADLNGVTGDFSVNNPYHGLNRFKMSFNPEIYEYIGEFDLIINEQQYNHLLKNGSLAKEFNK